jgi:hypothetical protein
MQPPVLIQSDRDPAAAASNDTADFGNPGSPVPGALARTEPAAMALAAMFSNALRALLPPPAPAAPKLFLDLDAAAQYTGLPRRLLIRLIRESQLPVMKFSGVVYIKRQHLDDLDAMPHVSEPDEEPQKNRKAVSI